MSKAIIICHHPINNKFVNKLLGSIETEKYKIIICENGKERPNNSFELGAIQYGKDNFDEFILLQDTCIIKDDSLFDELFKIKGHVFLTHGGYHYMGKFISEDLPEIPKISSKQESIHWELRWLHGKPWTNFEPDLPVHTSVFEDILGQNRMKLENKYIIKYKGTYSI